MLIPTEFDILVRNFEMEDSAAIAAICAELGYPATLEQIMRRYAALSAQSAIHRVYVAQVRATGTIVGWGMCMVCICLNRMATRKLAVWSF